MQMPQTIQSSLDYIEGNLKTFITAEELAGMANYSTYHYYRLFSSVVGSSVAEYITKRRLDHALAEIATGRKAAEVVLEYGFDTYAGFYKAFMRMYGCSPKKYLSIYQRHKPMKPEVLLMYTTSELKRILENWEIEKGLPIRDIYLMDGAKVSGNVWSVGDDYVLKTSGLEKLNKNSKMAKALDHQGFTAPLPVLSKTGDEIVDTEFGLFMLSRGAKGSPLSDAERFGADRVHFGEKYGRGIAKLHKALKEVQKDFSPNEVNLYRNVSEGALLSLLKQNEQWSMGLDESFFEDFTSSFGKLFDKLPKQLIHRDPNPSNILFQDGEVSGFLDFEFSEKNIRLWDPCYCATGILSEGSKEAYDTWPDILGSILRGYDSQVKLTPEEKQAVYYVICSIQMICCAYFESREEYKTLAKTNREMLKYIVANQETIKNILA